MKLFPSSSWSLELSRPHEEALEQLKRNTEITYTLVSQHTEKAFIGEVYQNGFKLITSKIGSGAICVFDGMFTENSGRLEVRIHKAFKILFWCWMIFVLAGLGHTIYKLGIDRSIGPMIIMILFVLLIIKVVVPFVFRLVSARGIQKLTNLLGVTKMEKIET